MDSAMRAAVPGWQRPPLPGSRTAAKPPEPASAATTPERTSGLTP